MAPTTTSLPLYSPLAGSEPSPSRLSSSDGSSTVMLDEPLNEPEQPLHAAQRHAGKTSSADASSSTAMFALPTMNRFLADFTLGFADGLTVPFALTAGLSSLGQTETVIYAGMAEICAGSISMGIGGYLAAKGEMAAEAAAEAREQERRELASEDEERDPEKTADTQEDEKLSDSRQSGVLDGYLAPLELPPHLLDQVISHVKRQPGIEESLILKTTSPNTPEADDNSRQCSPITVGFSVAVGYLLGGLLPLFPYFFVSHVGDGLLWSFGVCIFALFSFGFSKDFFVRRAERLERERDEGWVAVDRRRRSVVRWEDLRRSGWEGVQMVVLGSVAALAAVLCVRAFEGMSVKDAVS
jgi:vacuolar iron transporter family protein